MQACLLTLFVPQNCRDALLSPPRWLPPPALPSGMLSPPLPPPPPPPPSPPLATAATYHACSIQENMNLCARAPSDLRRGPAVVLCCVQSQSQCRCQCRALNISQGFSPGDSTAGSGACLCCACAALDRASALNKGQTTWHIDASARSDPLFAPTLCVPRVLSPSAPTTPPSPTLR